jgi:peptidoglycan hydrolase CwlO-like protein
MSFPARKSETKMPTPSERTVLEERVDHIQRDVTDLKETARRVDEKVDKVQAELSDFKTKVATDLGDIKAQIKGLEASMIRWMISLFVTSAGVASGVAFGLVKLLH